MGRTFVKLGEDEFIEWSSVVDAPVTWVMTADEAKAYMARAAVDGNGRPFGEDPERRWARLVEKGTTSHIDSSAEAAVSFNRAGPKESHLTLEQIRQRYASPEAERAFDASGQVIEVQDEHDPTWYRREWRPF